MRDILKYTKTYVMAGENSLNFGHIIKETCLMKCNTFYADQCNTVNFALKARRQKLLQARIDEFLSGGLTCGGFSLLQK